MVAAYGQTDTLAGITFKFVENLIWKKKKKKNGRGRKEGGKRGANEGRRNLPQTSTS